MISTVEARKEKSEQIARGKRIKKIREKELKMKKSELGKMLGVSGQFIGLVEDGNGNLMYRSIKKLRELSGHSADYILFGLDDSHMKETNKLLQKYNDKDIIQTIDTLKEIAILIKNKKM